MGRRILHMKIESLEQNGLDVKAQVTFDSQKVENFLAETFIPYPAGQRPTKEEEESRDKLKLIAKVALKQLSLGSYFVCIMSKEEMEFWVIEQVKMEASKLLGKE